jgi:hypothetical protein
MRLRPVLGVEQLVFGVAAIVIAAFLVRAWTARRAVNLLSAVALLGMLAMCTCSLCAYVMVCERAKRTSPFGRTITADHAGNRVRESPQWS